MDIGINKILEFLYALQGVIKVTIGDKDETYSYIETPDIPYFKEILELFKDIDLSRVDYYFKEVFHDQGDASIIGIALDDDFNLKYIPKINTVISDDELFEFVALIKNIKNKVNWDKFIEDHRDYYNGLLEEFSGFPDNFSLSDFIDFYKVEPNKFIYNPSVLMNGGFGLSDDSTNFYYVRGFRYDKKKEKFIVYLPAIVECLFHEFSHPIVNPLVDKYFSLLDKPFKLYDHAVENDLVSVYCDDVRTVYYEYMVRTVAYVLTLLYYPDYDIYMEYQESIGFDLLDIFVDKLSECIGHYDNFESMYVNEIIPFINKLHLGKER